jgi:hypothetical protein
MKYVVDDSIENSKTCCNFQIKNDQTFSTKINTNEIDYSIGDYVEVLCFSGEKITPCCVGLGTWSMLFATFNGV